MATIHDVAREAGVSIATVSRHVAGQKVRAAQAVERAIKELGFRPNTSARGLRMGRHNTVAAIVPDMSNPYFAQIVHGLEETIAVAGLRVVVASSNENPETQIQLLKRLGDAVDAFVLVPTMESSTTKDVLDSLSIPTVLVDRILHQESSYDVVIVDNEAGARLAAEHLTGLGHQRIGIISGPQTSLPGRLRHESFISSAARVGVKIPKELRQVGEFTQEFGYQAARKLLLTAPKPTALFVGNNLMTHGALRAIHELGISVPNELSVLGFDDFALADLLNPPLTVISRPAGLEGQISGRRLLQRLDDPHIVATEQILPVSLTLRSSTAAPHRKA